MYPDPCVECEGTTLHRITCPTIARGGGTRRDLCGSVSPYNRSHHCRKPKGHADFHPDDDEGFSTGYPPDSRCQDPTLDMAFVYEWDFEDGEQPTSVEVELDESDECAGF